MHQRRAKLLLLLLLLLPAADTPVADTPAMESLVDGGESRVVEVIDGDTLILADGREIRLVGIQAPKLPLGRPNFPTWPLAGEAKAFLSDLTQGQVLRVAYGGRRMDRHGRELGHLYLADGTWAQGRMLEAGLARVYSFADNRSLVADMLAREAGARAAGRGIWALPYYQVRDPETVGRYVDGYELVEGQVLRVAQVRDRIYLNYGEDWRRDFTVTIDRKAQRLFAETGVDPFTLEGRRIRVRGWVDDFNGPMIEATHPEQIELLPD